MFLASSSRRLSGRSVGHSCSLEVTSHTSSVSRPLSFITSTLYTFGHQPLFFASSSHEQSSQAVLIPCHAVLYAFSQLHFCSSALIHPVQYCLLALRAVAHSRHCTVLYNTTHISVKQKTENKTKEACFLVRIKVDKNPPDKAHRRLPLQKHYICTETTVWILECILLNPQEKQYHHHHHQTIHASHHQIIHSCCHQPIYHVKYTQYVQPLRHAYCIYLPLRAHIRGTEVPIQHMINIPAQRETRDSCGLPKPGPAHVVIQHPLHLPRDRMNSSFPTSSSSSSSSSSSPLLSCRICLAAATYASLHMQVTNVTLRTLRTLRTDCCRESRRRDRFSPSKPSSLHHASVLRTYRT